MRTILFIIMLLLESIANGYSQVAYPMKQIIKDVASKAITKQGASIAAKQGTKRAAINGSKTLFVTGTIKSFPTSKTLSSGAEYLCAKYPSKFSNAIPQKVKNEIDSYVDNVLVKERNYLRNQERGGRVLTDKENDRLKELNRMLPKEGRELSDNERINILNKIDLSTESISVKIPDNLSFDRWVHILLRHTSPQYQKSYFNFSSSD